MDKPVLRLGFTDYFENLDEFFVEWLSERYEIVRDDTNPDFLIFCDETFGQNNKTYDPTKVVKIFYTGENRRAWNYQCEVAITFDHYDQDNHYRLPLYVIDKWVMNRKLGMFFPSPRTPKTMAEKTGFCCFISGNPANQHRNDFFHKLSKYKKVDSYGPLFNNMGPLPRGPDAAAQKMSVLPKYKFNLCFENGDHPGYCTEKLMHALWMGTVPIYCGSSTAGLDFHSPSFLSWHGYLDDDKLLEMIVAVDENEEIYEAIFMNGNKAHKNNNVYADKNRFLNWFDKNVYPRKKQ